MTVESVNVIFLNKRRSNRGIVITSCFRTNKPKELTPIIKPKQNVILFHPAAPNILNPQTIASSPNDVTTLERMSIYDVLCSSSRLGKYFIAAIKTNNIIGMNTIKSIDH